MTLQAWADKYFVDGSRPSDVTLGRWVRQGVLPGRKIGGTWYVDENVWLADGDDLVERVLKEAS